MEVRARELAACLAVLAEHSQLQESCQADAHAPPDDNNAHNAEGDECGDPSVRIKGRPLSAADQREAVEAALTRLVETPLMEWGAGRVYRFTHQLFRDSVYGYICTAVQRRKVPEAYAAAWTANWAAKTTAAQTEVKGGQHRGSGGGYSGAASGGGGSFSSSGRMPGVEAARLAQHWSFGNRDDAAWPWYRDASDNAFESGAAVDAVVGLYKSNPVDPQRLKAPGF
jgi:hypothetical protein